MSAAKRARPAPKPARPRAPRSPESSVTHEGQPEPGGKVKLTLGVTLLVLAVLLVGCSGVPIPPTSSKDELRTTCQRQGGWWRGDYCERDSHR